MQVRHQLACGIARAADEFLQLRPPQRRIRPQLGLEHLGAARKAGCHRQADADRVVDFMGDAGDQAAERRQPFGVDQVLLGGVELEQRALGLLLGGAQFVLGLALGDGVFTEHLDRARHRADLVPGAGALHLAAVIARGDGVHRRHDLLQRQPDAERDQHAGAEDDAEEHHGNRQHPAGDVGQRPVERLLRLLLASAHLDRQVVDGADGFGLAGVDGVAQQLGAAGKLLRQFRQALAQCGGARLQPLQRQPLQVVVGEAGHFGDGLLDGVGVAAGFLGRGAGQREIIGVGGDQHRGEGLAGFSQRGPDQGVAVPGGALDDRIEPGHVARRGQHLVLIGLRNGGLDAAQLAKTVEETFGDAFELLHRPRQHRVGRGTRGEGAEHGLAQQQDLGEQLGAGLVDVAMDQVLQPAGFALQQRQNLVGFPHLPHVVPGRTEHLGAVPDHRGQHHDHRRVQRGDRQDAPADRHRAQQPDQGGAAPCGKSRRPFRSIVLPGGCCQGQLTPPWCG